MLNTVKLAGILVVIGCSFGAGPVWAQCVEGTTDGLGRTPVTCDTAGDTDGYAATVDQVDVVVAAGFDVAHGAATEAILLREDSTVVNDGTITATADDTQGIEAGDNAMVTNQGIGVIQGGGGATGAAILFSGIDATASNAVNNNGTGAITTSGTGTVAIQGSVGNETITLSDTSTLTGDIILGAGNDIVTIQDDATATGNVNLGDGTNQFAIRGTADLTGTIMGGAGNDAVTITDGSTVIGDIDLGTGANTLTINTTADYSGTITAGDGTITGGMRVGGGDNTVAIGGSTTAGSETEAFNIELGDGTNTFSINDTAELTGNITGGADVDTVSITDDSTVIGDINLGAGANTLTINTTADYSGTITAGDGNDTVTLTGTASTLTGAMILGGGDDIVNVGPGATIGAIDAGDGVDTLHLDRRLTATQIEGSVDLSTASEFQALLIGPDIQEDGYIWRVSTPGVSTATFDTTVLQAGVFIPEGTVRLTGDMTQNGSDTAEGESTAPTMKFELGPGGPTDPSNSHLMLTGELTLNTDDDLPGAASEVDFTGSIVEGSYTLITATDGIAGVFDVETVPDVAAFSFTTDIAVGVGLQKTYELTVVRELLYGDFARSDSEANVGSYFEDARLAGATTAFSDVTNALDLLGAGDLRTALAQSSPEVYDAHTSSVLSWGRVQQRVLQERSMRCDRYTYKPQPEIVSDAPCGTTGFMPWAKLAGDIRDRKGGESSGYESMGGGLLLGFDHRWDDTLWLSGDIGFARINIEHDNGADADFDSVDLGVAAGGEFYGVTTRGSLTYSHGFHETTRKIDFLNERAKGKHDSDRVTLAAGAGYRLKAGSFVVEPNATVDYTHVKEGSVDESGAGVADLDVSSRKTDVVSLTGGVRLGTNLLKYRYAGNWLEWADGVWSPGVSVGWRQGFGDVDRDQKAKMQGAPDGTESFKAEAEDSAGGVEVGAHVSFQPLNTATSVEVGYDGYFGDDVTNHSANVSVRVPF